MVLVRMVPVLVHARKRTFSMTTTTIRNTIYSKVFIFKIKLSLFCLSYIQKMFCRIKGAVGIKGCNTIFYTESCG